jgi:hypothetical protein
MENEELLLRNTFLNARMGPFVDYNQRDASFNKPKGRGRLVWADEKRVPLAQEGPDEYDLVNQVNVQMVDLHHRYDSSQLKSVLSTSKRLAFGPKYTGQGKVDFYAQNETSQVPENRKEEFYQEADMIAQPSAPSGPARKNYVPVTNTR